VAAGRAGAAGSLPGARAGRLDPFRPTFQFMLFWPLTRAWSFCLPRIRTFSLKTRPGRPRVAATRFQPLGFLRKILTLPLLGETPQSRTFFFDLRSATNGNWIARLAGFALPSTK
jgi:hypothetical protein